MQGNNPLSFIDPDGNELVVTGDGAENYTNALQIRTKMKVIRDSETGQISFEGKARTRNDKRLVQIAESKDVKVEIIAVENTDVVPNRSANVRFNGGGHVGTSYNCERAYSQQVVNTDVLNGMSQLTNYAYDFVLHELFNAFYSGQAAFNEGKELDVPLEFERRYSHYEEGRKTADVLAPIPSPYKMSREINPATGIPLLEITIDPGSTPLIDFKGGKVNARTGEINRNK